MDREQVEKWAREAIVFADTKRDWRKDGSWSEAFNEHFSHLAYNAGRAAAMDEAKEAVRPKSPRPCMCDRCTCGNQSDAEACAAWDATKQSEIAIAALAAKELQP